MSKQSAVSATGFPTSTTNIVHTESSDYDALVSLIGHFHTAFDWRFDVVRFLNSPYFSMVLFVMLHKLVLRLWVKS